MYLPTRSDVRLPGSVPLGDIEQRMLEINGDQLPFLLKVIRHGAEVIHGKPEDIRLTFTDAVWQDFGDALAEILTDWQAELKLEKIYVGGGISKAQKRFMTNALATLPLEFLTAENPNLSGAIRDFQKKNKQLTF